MAHTYILSGGGEYLTAEQIIARLNLVELLDRTLRAASDELIAEIRANRAAGRIPPVALPKSDVQADWDCEREFGWSVG